MRHSLSVATTVLALLLLAGCAHDPAGHSPESRASGEPAAAGQQDKAALMMRYRQEAADLREMANRRQLEANVMEKELGPDHEAVRRKRDLAQDLAATADEVEQKARDLRREVPHGMIH